MRWGWRPSPTSQPLRREAFTLSLFCSLAPGRPQPHRVPGGPHLPLTPNNGGAILGLPQAPALQPGEPGLLLGPPCIPLHSRVPSFVLLRLPCHCHVLPVLPPESCLVPQNFPPPLAPAPKPLGAVSSPHSPHVDPTWHLSVPPRCQNFDCLRAFARAVSSSGKLCPSNPDTASPVIISVFLHTQLNRPLESTAALTTSSELQTARLCVIVSCSHLFVTLPEDGKVGDHGCFLGPCVSGPFCSMDTGGHS